MIRSKKQQILDARKLIGADSQRNGPLTLADVNHDNIVGDAFIDLLLSKITGRYICGTRKLCQLPSSPPTSYQHVVFATDNDVGCSIKSWPAPPALLAYNRLKEAKRLSRRQRALSA